jgi:hypothetical protein
MTISRYSRQTTPTTIATTFKTFKKTLYEREGTHEGSRRPDTKFMSELQTREVLLNNVNQEHIAGHYIDVNDH